VKSSSAFPGPGNAVFGRLIDVGIGVAGHGDGLRPSADIGLDPAREDGGAENGSIQCGADRAVGARPHLLEAKFLHALGVGRDGRALDADVVFLDGSAAATVI
jgi:hypothetical protein